MLFDLKNRKFYEPFPLKKNYYFKFNDDGSKIFSKFSNNLYVHNFLTWENTYELLDLDSCHMTLIISPDLSSAINYGWTSVKIYNMLEVSQPIIYQSPKHSGISDVMYSSNSSHFAVSWSQNLIQIYYNKNYNLVFSFQSFSYNMLLGNNNILIYSTNCLSLCNFDEKEKSNFIWAQAKFPLTIVDSQFNDACLKTIRL
jgi:hypothetical protein